MPPTAIKSASLKVVFWKPKSPSIGRRIKGKKVRRIPFTKAPIKHPLFPPVAFPNTPAVAPQKKCGTTPGIINIPPVIPKLQVLQARQ